MWIHTYTTKHFHPTRPSVEDIDILDIAHALSNTCRFNGHSKKFYSVAEHCTRMSYINEIAKDLELAKWALLHDASEIYISDIPAPVKSLIGGKVYTMEQIILREVAKKFNLSLEAYSNLIHIGDQIMLSTEVRDLINGETNDWGLKRLPLKEKIVPWTSIVAEKRFLKRAKELQLL